MASAWIAGSSDAELDVLGECGCEQPEQVREHVLDVHRRTLALHATGEGQQLAEHGGSVVHTALQRAQRLVVEGPGLLQLFEREPHRGEHVVEVVCDASGERADGLHALGAQPLPLLADLVGDVAGDRQHAGDLSGPLRVVERGGVLLHPAPRAVERNQLEALLGLLALEDPGDPLGEGLAILGHQQLAHIDALDEREAVGGDESQPGGIDLLEGIVPGDALHALGLLVEDGAQVRLRTLERPA